MINMPSQDVWLLLLLVSLSNHASCSSAGVLTYCNVLKTEQVCVSGWFIHFKSTRFWNTKDNFNFFYFHSIFNGLYNIDVLI